MRTRGEGRSLKVTCPGCQGFFEAEGVNWMMIPRFVFFLCIVLAWRWGWSQTIVPVDWAALTRDSTVVVIGVGLPGNYWVTHPDKMIGQSIRQTGGTILYELPNIGKYVAGNIVRVTIEDAIKKDGKIKTGDNVSTFAAGLSHIYA